MALIVLFAILGVIAIITKGTVPIVRKLYNAASRRVTYGGRN